MKKILLSGSICLTIGMISCGGSSGGLSEDVSVLNTVIVFVKESQPGYLNSDVIIRKRTTETVKSGSPDCNTLITANNVCTGKEYTPENLTITFKSEPIKNVQGQPLVANPSPVRVEKYRVSFTQCIQGVYEFPINLTIPPNEERTVVIQPITPAMKEAIVKPTQYIYINNDDECQTVFDVVDYPSPCVADANFEFLVYELYSGKRATVKYRILVRFEDFPDQDQCRIR